MMTALRFHCGSLEQWRNYTITPLPQLPRSNLLTASLAGIVSRHSFALARGLGAYLNIDSLTTLARRLGINGLNGCDTAGLDGL